MKGAGHARWVWVADGQESCAEGRDHDEVAVVGVQRRIRGIGAVLRLLVAHWRAGDVAQLHTTLADCKRGPLLDVAPIADADERDVPAEALASLPCGQAVGSRRRGTKVILVRGGRPGS